MIFQSLQKAAFCSNLQSSSCLYSSPPFSPFLPRSLSALVSGRCPLKLFTPQTSQDARAVSRSPVQQRARDILCVRVTQQLFTLPVARNGALTCSRSNVLGRRCTGGSGLGEKKRVDDSGGMKRVGGGGGRTKPKMVLTDL